MHGGNEGGFRWVLLWNSDGVNPIGWTLVGFWILHGWTLVLLGFAYFFSSVVTLGFFFFFFNMGFCSRGILVGSG